MATARVRSTAALRRRNLQVVFSQTLEVEAGGGAGGGGGGGGWTTAAFAEVTCTCLSRDTGRPVPCPPALAERFGGGG